LKPIDKLPPGRDSRHINVVWKYYAGIFDKVFHVVEPWSPELAPHIYVSALTTDLLAFPREVRKDVAKLIEQKVAVGDNEALLFSYCFKRAFRDPLFLVGDIGHGKSTLLRYSTEFLMPRTPSAARFLTISLDLFTSQRQKLAQAIEPVWHLLGERIHDKLRNYLSDPHFVSGLWKFIKCYEPSFAPYANRMAMGLGQSATVEDDAHLQADYYKDNCREFLKAALLYLALCKGTPVLVVIDNIDMFGPQVQVEAYHLANWLCDYEPSRYAPATQADLRRVLGIKCVVPVRRSTWDHLPHRCGQTLDYTESITPPLLNDILDLRFECLAQLPETKDLVEDLKQTPLVYRGKNYRHEDVSKVFSCLQRTLLSQRNAEALSALSNDNIRYALAFAERFLSSGEIPDVYLSPALFARYVDKSLPRHIFSRAMLLGDRDVFSEGDFGRYTTFTSLFYTPCGGASYEHTVAYRLLVHLARVPGRSGYVAKDQLAPFRDSLFPALDLEEILRRWLHFGLIESPEAGVVEEYAQLKTLRLAPAGIYYLGSLVNTLSYLECVKDVCEMQPVCTVGPLPMCSSVEDKIRETLKFCEYLIGREREELNGLKGSASRSASFVIFCGHAPCVSSCVMEQVSIAVGRIGDVLVGQSARAASRELQSKAQELLNKAKELSRDLAALVQTTQVSAPAPAVSPKPTPPAQAKAPPAHRTRPGRRRGRKQA
jgi:hypothetical protein